MPAISFRAILDKALADYRDQIGVELDKHPFVGDLRGHDSPDDVLKLLEDKANSFKVYRDGNRKLINWLKPVVQTIHTLSGLLGEAVAVSLMNRMRWIVFSSFAVLLPGAIPTGQGNLRRCRCSHHSAHQLKYPSTSFLIWINQAADGVSSSYDALVDLFECLGNFLKRLRIYTDVPLTPGMVDIVANIMVELLSVFALATKQIKQGRFSKWITILNTRWLKMV